MRLKHAAVAATALLGLGLLAGCSGSHPAKTGASNASAASTVGEQPPGMVKVVVVDTAPQLLSIQRCVQAPGGGVNFTAQGSTPTVSTMIANLTAQPTASTLSWTIPQSGNEFTTYTIQPSGGSVVSGTRAGNRLKLNGWAIEQGHTATGALSGAAQKLAITLDATCKTIQALQPAAAVSHATTSPAAHPGTTVVLTPSKTH